MEVAAHEGEDDVTAPVVMPHLTEVSIGFYIRGVLHNLLSEEAIAEYFTPYGEIASVQIPARSLERKRGYAFVNFMEPVELRVGDHVIHGCTVSVSVPTERKVVGVLPAVRPPGLAVAAAHATLAAGGGGGQRRRRTESPPLGSAVRGRRREPGHTTGRAAEDDDGGDGGGEITMVLMPYRLCPPGLIKHPLVYVVEFDPSTSHVRPTPLD